MKTPRLHAFAAALIICLFSAGVDYFTGLELGVGLDALFRLRGPRPPPPDVVVIAMDEASENSLGVGDDLSVWRKSHIKLINELHSQGARLIIFDLQFIALGPADQEFAKAMGAAGNVLLIDCVQKLRRGDQDFFGRDECSEDYKRVFVDKEDEAETRLSQDLVAMRKISANPELLAAALDHAPFYLPNDAANATVREAWLYYPSLGDSPALPMLAWLYSIQRSGGWPESLGLLEPYAANFSQWRQQCGTIPAETTPAVSALEQRFYAVLCRYDSRYLDYFGPPHSVRMESYSDVYAGKVTDLHDKVVFVGKASRSYLPGKMDFFPSPFTNSETGNMSGVEIMATEFANLSESRFIESPLPPLLALLIYGWPVSWLLSRYTGKIGIAASLLFTGVYLGLALVIFSRYAWWLPVATPVLVQWPVTMLVWFIYKLRDWMPMDTTERDVYGVCLATDIVDWTSISGGLPSEVSSELLNNYNKKVINAPVRLYGGRINDLTGDGAMSYWDKPPIQDQRYAACRAALKILDCVDEFNKTSAPRLEIRIGLSEGRFTLSLSDAGDIKTFKANGSPLNFASRIEGVNKDLGTRLLAAKPICDSLDGIFYRRAGCFLVQGSNEPLELMEIVGLRQAIGADRLRMYRQFELGLDEFQQGGWWRAAEIFQAVLKDYPEDGPSSFFLRKALDYSAEPPDDWRGVVAVEKN